MNELEEFNPSQDYKAKEKDVETIFKDMQDSKVSLIKESIVDIQKMIKERGVLHKDMFSDIDKVEMFIDNSMPKTGQSNPELLAIKQELIKELLKKKIEIHELRIQEKLNFWRDVAQLKETLRDYIKEYGDMESKVSMLDNILEL